MLPETIQRITPAVQATRLFMGPDEDPLELAISAIRRAQGASTPEEAEGHTLRAIAYLVRRLELDAAEPTRSGPGAG